MGVERKAIQDRIDTATRVILASPRSLFRAFVDEEMLQSWRPPDGMTARIERFDPRVGGGYRMVLTHAEGSDAQGTTNAREDVVDVSFVELTDTQIIESVRFQSVDPAYAEPMTLTTRFEPVVDGTKVTFAASEVPATIDAEDHKTGMASALRHLARLTE